MAKVPQWKLDLQTDQPMIAVPDFCPHCQTQVGLQAVPYNPNTYVTDLRSDGIGDAPITYSVNKQPCNEAAFKLAVKQWNESSA